MAVLYLADCGASAPASVWPGGKSAGTRISDCGPHDDASDRGHAGDGAERAGQSKGYCAECRAERGDGHRSG